MTIYYLINIVVTKHSYKSHGERNGWSENNEEETVDRSNRGRRPGQTVKQRETTTSLLQPVWNHEPVIDELNETGEAFLWLIAKDQQKTGYRQTCQTIYRQTWWNVQYRATE